MTSRNADESLKIGQGEASQELGYSPNGVKTIVAQDGQAHVEHQVILAASDIDRGPDPVEVAGAEVVRRFLGLDAS